MIFDLNVSFPNALMFLVLEDSPEPPEIDGVANLWQTESMLGQAVLHDAEGQVHLTVGAEEPEESLIQLFRGHLRSSRKKIEIWNVYVEELATFKTDRPEFDLAIWGNDPRQSSRVHIQFLSGSPSLA